jgi:hypothetical protein
MRAAADDGPVEKRWIWHCAVTALQADEGGTVERLVD